MRWASLGFGTPGSVAIGLALMAFAGACASSKLPTLPPSQPPPDVAADPPASQTASQSPHQTAVIVSGTPTDVYALVARGALGCWLGADGPLKATHVFHAEAEPPAKGGTAEIVIHERDVTLRDQRGVRAYRIAFASEATGVRVGMLALRFEPPLVEVMAKDVATWAKGGAGCELRTVLPQQAATPVVGKGGTGPGGGNKR